MGAVTDAHRSADGHAGRDMRVSTNDAIVVDAGPGVKNGVRAKPAPCLHNGPCKNLDAILDLDFRRDNRRGMDHCGETVLLLDEPVVDSPAISRAADRADTIHQTDTAWPVTEYRAVIAKMTGPQQGRTHGIGIHKSENSSLKEEKRTHQHPGVIASPNDDDRQFLWSHRPLEKVVPVEDLVGTHVQS